MVYPQSQYVATPAQFGLKYQSVTIRTASGDTLNNWYLPATSETRANVLFLHGNAENISTHMHSAAWLVQHGYGVFLLDYRGFGASTGQANLTTLHEDALYAYDWLSQQEHPIAIFGQSMGGAIAIVTTARLNQANRPPFALKSVRHAPDHSPD
ncbi:MAG: alpha/beta fold hydrolase [Oleiphilaceae bacterium]|nr:alpha/beta fold hydrolase [Oleiphilaceae bacterium]